MGWVCRVGIGAPLNSLVQLAEGACNPMRAGLVLQLHGHNHTDLYAGSVPAQRQGDLEHRPRLSRHDPGRAMVKLGNGAHKAQAEAIAGR